MVYRTGLLLLALFLLITPLWGQESDNGQPTSEDIRQYEERLREMVGRFEEARELLRRQIDENQALRRENAELRRRMENLQEEREQLAEMSEDERVAVLRERLRNSRRLNDALIRKLKATVDDNERLEARLKKAEGEQLAVQDEFLDILELREEQSLFHVGTGFSPEGYMNGLVLLNIPRTSLGLFAETNYRFREKDWAYSVGVQFRFGRLTEILELVNPSGAAQR
ncbi:MAG: hypothetical protein ACLFNP_05850 [Spirochaetaceae bacterium]